MATRVHGQQWSLNVGVEDILVPAAICSLEGVFLAINSPAVDLLGTWAEPGAAVHELGVTEQEQREIQTVWAQQGQAHAGWDHEFHFEGRAGVEVHVLLTAVPILDDLTGVPAWLLTIEDISRLVIHARQLEIYAQELSRLYRTNRQHIQQLEEAQRSRELFFSLVTHELKTPLTAQKAALEMLSHPDMLPRSPQDFARLVGTLQRSTLRLERLISDLLDVATARGGRLSLAFHPVDLAKMIEAAIEEVTGLLREKSVTLKWSPSRSKRGLTVRGDETRLFQVVLNLLSNAIKAAPDGGRITVALRREDKAARVSVANPGVTIDPAIKDALFEPFMKSQARGYRSGAGLGLAVVNELVKAHGGEVHLQTTPEDVTFTFTIPLLAQEAGP